MRRLLCLALMVALAGGCAVQVPRIEPGQDAGAAEATSEGLWLVSRHAEQAFAGSGLLAPDSLQAYVRNVNCQVAGAYCPDIRVYTAEIPDFNASMAPNGFMQVWSGMLLRVENEAQLATVLGHETAHFVLRHSLERFRTQQRTANLLLATQVGLLAGGVGGVAVGPVGISSGNIVQLIASGYLASYTREQEAEADRDGFDRMAEAGYAPGEAAEVWRHLMQEQEQCDLPRPPALFASHPPSDERLESLRTLARQRGGGGQANRQAFLDAILPYRGEWLRMELAQHQFCRTRVLLERLIEQGADVGELYYYRGELYRRRGEDGDLDKAITAYRRAIGQPGAPATVHRELGLALWQAGERHSAKASLRRYLQTASNPDDGAMVRAYIEELE